MRKRTAVIGLVSLVTVAALGSACALLKGGIGQPARKEYAVIAVGTRSGQCVVLEDKISKIRTSFEHAVTWIIVGSCEGSHTVGIGEFTKRGNRLDPTVPSKREASATDGARIQVTVKPRQPKGEKETPHGLYVYQVLIDGKPAPIYRVPVVGKAAEDGVDPGEFDICPEWPCRKV